MLRARERQLDSEAARSLRYERYRHALVAERLRSGDAGAILWELNRHHQRVSEILTAFARRRRERDTLRGACPMR